MSSGPPSHVTGTSTTPVYDYATAIRETVYVETTLDNDGDGTADRVVADIIRPREAAAAGVKVPVIMDASPYYPAAGAATRASGRCTPPTAR